MLGHKALFKVEKTTELPQIKRFRNGFGVLSCQKKKVGLNGFIGK